jgi:hypothetical protein
MRSGSVSKGTARPKFIAPKEFTDMLRTPLWLAVALLTCTLGLTTVWLVNLGSQLADAALDTLMATPSPADLPSPACAYDNDSYAVYSSLIEAEFVVEGVELVVIKRQVMADSPFPFDQTPDGVQLLPLGAARTTIGDYLKQNSEQRELQRAFSLSVPYVIVDEDELSLLAGARLISGRVSTRVTPARPACSASPPSASTRRTRRRSYSWRRRAPRLVALARTTCSNGALAGGRSSPGRCRGFRDAPPRPPRLNFRSWLLESTP